jgi:two-component system NarL family response regulator
LDGLRDLLVRRGIDVAGTARDGIEALAQARSLRPDVILMDIQMPRCDGLAATRLIKAEMPDVQIVILTMAADDESLFEAIRSGASGYLLKTLDTEEFFALLLGVERGETPLSPGIAARILASFARRADEARPDDDPPLSSRQAQVLGLVSQGLLYKEVGEALGISERTVKYHMGEIVQRLHLHSRAEIIAYARSHGLDG